MVASPAPPVTNAEAVLTALEWSARKAAEHESVAPLTSEPSKWGHLADTPFWAKAMIVVYFKKPLTKRERAKVVAPQLYKRFTYWLRGDDFNGREMDRDEAVSILAGNWYQAAEVERTATEQVAAAAMFARAKR